MDSSGFVSLSDFAFTICLGFFYVSFLSVCHLFVLISFIAITVCGILVPEVGSESLEGMSESRTLDHQITPYPWEY